MAEQTKEKKKLGQKIKGAGKNFRSEFKKIVWMNKKQLLKSTGIVLAAIAIFGVVLAALDYGCGKGIFWLKDLFDQFRPVG